MNMRLLGQWGLTGRKRESNKFLLISLVQNFGGLGVTGISSVSEDDPSLQDHTNDPSADLINHAYTALNSTVLSKYFLNHCCSDWQRNPKQTHNKKYSVLQLDCQTVPNVKRPGNILTLLSNCQKLHLKCYFAAPVRVTTKFARRSGEKSKIKKVWPNLQPLCE